MDQSNFIVSGISYMVVIVSQELYYKRELVENQKKIVKTKTTISAMLIIPQKSFPVCFN